METAALKSFATKARTDLIKEVGARVSVVLAENSLARVESLSAVRRLEQAIVSDGRDEVVDRIAYTWFNRIIALRFMDANGYTPSAIVSPEAGRTSGQPEVLAEAKAGTFDNSVVPAKTQATITALFNRTRPSQDPDGEAYGLLLEAYCRSWHRTMPFMFEREGDYTELLIPAALLAVDSVRDRAVKSLTADVCRDVEVIGWLYQFYISERKDEVFDGFKKNKKAGAAEIPAATQLFTPHWIVRYLVENSLGRLWLLNNPSSRLAEQMDYYIKPADQETEFLKIANPEDLKIIDPAVGSGHMLTYAFDLLYAIYTERGYDPAEIPGLILEHNLYGTEIDPRAGALAAFALTMRAAAKRKLFIKDPIQPNIRILESVRFDPDELDYLWSLSNGGSDVRADADVFWSAFEDADTLGSLIQTNARMIAPLKAAVAGAEVGGDLLGARTLAKAAAVIQHAEYLTRAYSVVIANPPYMGRGAMSDLLVRFADATYPSSKSDLFAMFIDRARILTDALGATAMVTMQSWMFLPSLQTLRRSVLTSNELSTLAHIGPRGFDSIGGEVVQTCAFVIWNRPPRGARCTWLRLLSGRDEADKSSVLRSGKQRYLLAQQELLSLPGAAMGYWLSGAVRASYADGRSVRDLVISDGQTKTGDNDRFLRCWWEVSAKEFGWGRKWVLHPKGGGNRRWYGNVFNVIDWSDEARVHYRKDRVARILPDYLWNRRGISWSNISTSASLGFRVLDPGQVFNLKAPTVFLRDEDRLPELLGYLNSPVASYIVSALNPTISVNVNDVTGLPWKDSGEEDRDSIVRTVEDLIDLARADWNSFEEAAGFEVDRLVHRAPRTGAHVSALVSAWRVELEANRNALQLAEASVFRHFIDLFGLGNELTAEGEPEKDSLRSLSERELVVDMISYAVGCMFGRYSLDEPGLILADQANTLGDYVAKVPKPSFMPDQDNVIPIVDGDWFEDDIVARFRTFLRVAFGEGHFEENLQFVTESLGVKDIRDYFVKSFYDDHVRRYKKRPVYWLFRSPKGSFSALIYLHRYTSSTASTVLTGYLREFIGKLEANLEHQERVASGMGGASTRDVASALKEADRIRKVLVELRDYEHDVLFPLAGEQIVLDLDDGVVVNYQKLGAALKDIGLKKGGGGE